MFNPRPHIRFDGFSTGEAASYQPESEAYFARQSGISEFEKEIVNDWFVRYKASGNKMDEYFLPLKEGDSKIGFFSKTGTLNSGASIDSDGFFDFNASGYFDTNFTPSVDGVNYQTNDAIVSCFVRELSSTGVLFGVNQPNGRAIFAYSASIGNLQVRINGNSGITFSELPTPNAMLDLLRDSSTNVETYRDGSLIHTDSVSSNGVPTSSIKVGAYDNLGSIILPINGKTGVLGIGAGDGFDTVASNEYNRLYIASLISGTNISDLSEANDIINANSKIALFGDSITVGSESNFYESQMETLTGNDVVRTGGSGYSWAGNLSSDSVLASVFATNPGTIVMMSVNDHLSDETIGSAASTSGDGTTIGGLKKIFDYFDSYLPNADILFCYPTPYNFGGVTSQGINGNGDTVDDFITEMSIECASRSIPTLDLHEIFDYVIEGTASRVNTTDGLHLNEDGYNIMTPLINDEL